LELNNVTSSFEKIETVDYNYVRARLLAKQEIGFLDVREEHPHACGHPLFAANFPLSRLEVDALSKLPRRSVPIVTFDDGEGPSLALLAAQRLRALGYDQVAVFDGGLKAWRSAGGEIFIDVNVPSKSFGELVESKAHTPSLSAQDVKVLLDAHADVVIVDARRFDEYQTMSIPTAISCPGAELVLRVPELAPNPNTQVIVNCAGRTRSIIGAQSLINAGIPNKVAALRNGTIGWVLAEQKLDKGAKKRFPEVSSYTREQSAGRARQVADRAGVKRASQTDTLTWQAQTDRTTYFFDTRTTEEYAAGHLSGFRNVPGGQLVQETEMVAPVRGARIVLVDTDGVRANMTASWLAQMAWDVCVLDGVDAASFDEVGAWHAPLPSLPLVESISAGELADSMNDSNETVVIDLGKHAAFIKGHIPGAYYLLRSQFDLDAEGLPKAKRYVLTCPDGLMACFAAEAISGILNTEVLVLEGGTDAWIGAGFPLDEGAHRCLSPVLDRYKRPYEGMDNKREAMQAYLDWEFGLVEQLGRDGTHHFQVL
jgi:rhodanese-related sulfurtransferase